VAVAHLFDGVVGSPGCGAAVGVDFGVAELDDCGECGDAEDTEHVGEEGFVAEPAEVTLGKRGAGFVEDGDGGDWDFGVDGGIEEGGVEADDLASIGAGALGEEEDGHAVAEPACHLLDGFAGAVAGFAVDEKGCAEVSEFAEDGPCGDFAFCYEGAGEGRGADEDVEVA